MTDEKPRSMMPPSEQDGQARSRQLNKAHWESVSKFHDDGSYYMTQSVLGGATSLSEIELKELGNISQLVGAHFQCGIGLETISLQRLGAKMTGFDFAETAINSARTLAKECNSDCQFIEADVLDANSMPRCEFNFVYASHGVLRWISDLRAWSENAARALQPGGFLYIFEIHPLIYKLQNVSAGGLLLAGDYFDESGTTKEIKSSHIGVLPAEVAATVVHYNWTIGSVIEAVVGAGLAVKFMREHDGCSYSRKGLLPTRRGALWYLESSTSPIPMSFSVMAVKPQM